MDVKLSGASISKFTLRHDLFIFVKFLHKVRGQHRIKGVEQRLENGTSYFDIKLNSHSCLNLYGVFHHLVYHHTYINMFVYCFLLVSQDWRVILLVISLMKPLKSSISPVNLLEISWSMLHFINMWGLNYYCVKFMKNRFSIQD